MQSHDLAFHGNVYIFSLMSCMSRYMGVCLHVHYAVGGLFVKEDDLTGFINRSDVSYPRSILVRYPTRDLLKAISLLKQGVPTDLHGIEYQRVRLCVYSEIDSRDALVISLFSKDK